LQAPEVKSACVQGSPKASVRVMGCVVQMPTSFSQTEAAPNAVQSASFWQVPWQEP
jgi:hypothetical protein